MRNRCVSVQVGKIIVKSVQDPEWIGVWYFAGLAVHPDVQTLYTLYYLVREQSAAASSCFDGLSGLKQQL